MNLQDIIDTREDQEPIWVAYPDSETFQVLIRPLGGRNEEFLEKARRVEWDEALMERRIVIDREAYLKLFCANVIETWKGLYVGDLRKLVLIKNIRQVNKFKGEITCDESAKLLLMLHSHLFEFWAKQTCRNIELFNDERERALKKN